MWEPTVAKRMKLDPYCSAMEL